MDAAAGMVPASLPAGVAPRDSLDTVHSSGLMDEEDGWVYCSSAPAGIGPGMLALARHRAGQRATGRVLVSRTGRFNIMHYHDDDADDLMLHGQPNQAPFAVQAPSAVQAPFAVQGPDQAAAMHAGLPGDPAQQHAGAAASAPSQPAVAPASHVLPHAPAPAAASAVLPDEAAQGLRYSAGPRQEPSPRARWEGAVPAQALAQAPAGPEEHAQYSPLHHPATHGPGLDPSSISIQRYSRSRDGLVVLTQRLWPDHCVVGTPGADLVSDLAVVADDILIRKGTRREVDGYSAFYDNSRWALYRMPAGTHAWMHAAAARCSAQAGWLAGSPGGLLSIASRALPAAQVPQHGAA